MLIRFVPTLLAYINKNKGDKFYCRKSMQAADEKLIISELGPYQVEGIILVYNLPLSILCTLSRCSLVIHMTWNL